MPTIRISKQHLRIYGLLSLTCFIFYANCIRNYYSEDDYRVTSDFLRKNPPIEKGFAGIPEIFTSRYTNTNVGDLEVVYGYRPMARATFAIEWALWGQNPHLGHLVNILLYCLTCCMLFYVLTKSVFRNKDTIYPLLTTLLFIAHPLHTEVVVSLKNREEQLSFLFGLLFIATIWRYFTTRNVLLPWLAVFILVCAVMSKETGIIYLALAPLLVFFFHPDAQRTLETKEKISLTAILGLGIGLYAALVKVDAALFMTAVFIAIIWVNKRKNSALVAYSLVGFLVIFNSFLVPDALLAKTQSGHYLWASPLFTDISFSERIGFMLNAFLFNLKLLFYPAQLGFYYGYNMVPVTGIFAPKALFALAIITGLLYLAYAQYKKNKMVTFTILFFFLAFAPFSNIIPVPGIAADRFLYVPSLSFCIGLCFLLINLKKWAGSKTNRIIYIGAGLVGIIYFARVFNRNQDWNSYFSLYSHDAKYLTNSAKANSMYATLLIDNVPREKDPNKQNQLVRSALKHYEQSLKVYPTYAESLNALGFIYFKSGKYEKALQYHLKNLKYNPEFTPVYVNIASCYHLMNDVPNATKYYTLALKYDSLSTEVYLNFSDLYAKENKPDSAIYVLNLAKQRKIKNAEIDASLYKLTTK